MAANPNNNNLDEDVLAVLKVDGNGWNPQLFENQAALSQFGCLCAACGSVCDTPTELACDLDVEHKDDDILAHCRSCLQRRITENDGKCPIDSHERPQCIRNKQIHKSIANLIVFCPYSTAYQQRQRNNDDLDIAAAANHGVQDTMGAADDEKEGGGRGAAAVPPPPRHEQQQQPGQVAESRVRCEWKGKLKELIGEHITECMKLNDSSFVYKTQIKRLRAEMVTMQRRLNEKEQENERMKVEMDDLAQQLKQQRQALHAKDVRFSEKEQEYVNKEKALNQRVAVLSEQLKQQQTEHEEMMKEIQRNLDEQLRQNTVYQQESERQQQRIDHLSTSNEELSHLITSMTEQQQKQRRETQQKLQAKDVRIRELLQSMASMTEQQKNEEEKNEEKPKLNARKFAFNRQPKSQKIQIRNKTTIKNTKYELGKYHCITFGEVIDCVEYKQYRIKFKINKMDRSFSIGYGANKQALKDVDETPGDGANKATTTGIWVYNDNEFYLYDKNHFHGKIVLLGGKWTNGWYENRNGYVFVMEFDFKGKVFSLYDQTNRKLFTLPNEYKSVLPMFSLCFEDDEIEIVQCDLY